MNLQRFIDAKREELASLRRQMPPALPVSSRSDFLSALRGEKKDFSPLRVVAEFKRSSPSAGVINATRTPEEAAQAYVNGGASCMSVLTEEKYFRGCTEDLFRAHAVAPTLPLLRKDFIFHELQVRQTAATPASALLLIVALPPDAVQLRDLRQQAEEQGIHAVVEIFSEAELDFARESGARIIQVNARNLETFRTDREAGLHLARFRLSGEVWIAASAMSEREHLVAAASAGYDAALVGTALMQAESPQQKLCLLLDK